MSCPGRSTSPITAGATGSSPSTALCSPTTSTSSSLRRIARRRQVADPELRALQVGDQRERLAGLLLHLAHDLRPRGVVLVGPVREVEANGVDAGVDERADRVVGRRGRPDGRHDLRPPPFCCHLVSTLATSVVRKNDGEDRPRRRRRRAAARRSVPGMSYVIGTAAPASQPTRSSRGEKRFADLARGVPRDAGWCVAFGARHADVLELAALEEAFAADGADRARDDVRTTGTRRAARYGDEPVRLPDPLPRSTSTRRITLDRRSGRRRPSRRPAPQRARDARRARGSCSRPRSSSRL